MRCPDCPTAQVVRASVFDSSFWENMILLCAPLAVIALISLLLYRLGLSGTGTRGHE